MPLFDFLKQNKKETALEHSLEALLPTDYSVGSLSVEDIIAPSALKINTGSLALAGKFARTLFVVSYPRFLNEDWLGSIINLPKIFNVSIHAHPVDTANVLRQLQKKLAGIQSEISTREDKGLVRDPKLDTAYQDIERLRDQLQQSQEKLFDVGLYITLFEDSEAELNKTEQEIKSILEARLIYLKPALFQQEEGFRTVMPIGNDELEIHTKLNSAPFSSFFPFTSFDLTSNKGILYGVNRHNSGLVIFDRYSLENYNSIIFAKSGAGKSYLTKLEILRTLMFDTEVIVIDPEREYEHMCEAVGGRYFNISLNSEHHINPFDLPIAREDESPGNILRTNIITLVGLFRILLGGLSTEEDALMDTAITETYALKDITEKTDFKNAEPPLLSDLALVLSGMQGAESLVQRLTKYTTGTWAGFINQPTNVDINKKFIVFSVRDMEDDLKPAAMYIITHFIWNAIRKELKKRLLVVDEAWWMMKSEDTASFILSLAKRGRKYYLGLATITQDVGDFLRSPYGLPIITNSSIQILLKQSPASIDLVKKTFNLSDEEKYLLLESGVGQGIFFAGQKHVAIEVIRSETEHQLITSNPAEIIEIKKRRAALKETQSKE